MTLKNDRYTYRVIWSEGIGQRSEIRDQRAEGRGQRAEGRGQRAGNRLLPDAIWVSNLTFIIHFIECRQLSSYADEEAP